MFKKRFRGKSTSFKILKIFIQNFSYKTYEEVDLSIKINFLYCNKRR